MNAQFISDFTHGANHCSAQGRRRIEFTAKEMKFDARTDIIAI